MFHCSRPYAYFFRLWLTVLVLLATGSVHATFTDHGDGTVSDTLTGLIWDQCSWGQSGSACSSGSASAYTWKTAQGVAASARASAYKGHNDWRLPNVAELESLVKIDATAPTIDAIAFPKTPSNVYWSSTIFTPEPAFALLVGFNDGYAYARGQSNVNHVRLVRDGQSFDSFDSQSPGTSLTAQTITFGAVPSLLVGGSGTLSATASSGLAITFTSTTTTICTVTANTVSGVAVGTCAIAADQPGNSSTSPAPQAMQTFAIAAGSAAPNPPTNITITAGSGSATLNFSVPANTGGSPITRYTATCTANGQTTRTATGSTSPLIVKNLSGNIAYQCTLTATNSGGLTSSASVPLPVTPMPAKKSGLTPILMLLFN